MKDQIRELRIHIDGLHQLVNGLDKGIAVDLSLRREDEPMLTFIIRAREMGLTSALDKPSYQTKKAADSLLMSKYWLGEALKAIDVEVTPDIETGNDWENSSLNTHPEKVSWLIEEINRAIISGIKSILGSSERGKYCETRMIYYYFKSRDRLNEAAFWLEEELKRIQDEQV